MDSPQEQSISWTVETHTHTPRSVDWYWGLGVAVAAGAVLSIFFGNLLLAFILVIGASSLGVLVARGPREHKVTLDGRGLSVDGTLYRYQALHSFWIERLSAEQGGPRLLLTTGGVLSPQLIIPLLDERRAQNVHSLLKRFLTEEEQHPHLGDSLAQMLGL